MALPGADIAIVGGTSTDMLEARIESWFKGQSTPVHTSRVARLDSSEVFAPTTKRGVRVWILFSSPASARLFFAVQQDARAEPRYLVANAALDGGLDELGTEKLAQVVYSSVTALWAGDVESSRAEVEQGLRLAHGEPKSVPTTRIADSPPTKSRGLAIAPVLEYTVRARGDEGLAQGPGAALGVSWPGHFVQLGTALHGGALLPNRPVQSGVELQLVGATVGLGFSAMRAVSRRVQLTGELGPGLDFVHYGVASSSDPSLRAGGAHLDVRPLAYARLGVRFRLGFTDLGVSALVAVQFLRAHYDVNDRSSPSNLLRPWVVQPGVAAEAFF
jgi:hypothetical protein